jgi:antitoxin Phd
MDRWPVQDAKARFSELLDLCISEGPQLVTKRGEEAAMLVPIRAWRELESRARPTLKDLLLSPTGRGEIDISPRGRLRFRSLETKDD